MSVFCLRRRMPATTAAIFVFCLVAATGVSNPAWSQHASDAQTNLCVSENIRQMATLPGMAKIIEQEKAQLVEVARKYCENPEDPKTIQKMSEELAVLLDRASGQRDRLIPYASKEKLAKILAHQVKIISFIEANFAPEHCVAFVESGDLSSVFSTVQSAEFQKFKPTLEGFLSDHNTLLESAAADGKSRKERGVALSFDAKAFDERLRKAIGKIDQKKYNLAIFQVDASANLTARCQQEYFLKKIYANRPDLFEVGDYQGFFITAPAP